MDELSAERVECPLKIPRAAQIGYTLLSQQNKIHKNLPSHYQVRRMRASELAGAKYSVAIVGTTASSSSFLRIERRRRTKLKCPEIIDPKAEGRCLA